MKNITRNRIVATCLLTIMASIAQADPAVRVFVVEAKDAAAYLKEIDRGRAIMKRLRSVATVRVLQARFAGTNVGHVVTLMEFPEGIAQMLTEQKRLNEDPEFAAWNANLENGHLIRSDSIYSERVAQ